MAADVSDQPRDKLGRWTSVTGARVEEAVRGVLSPHATNEHRRRLMEEAVNELPDALKAAGVTPDQVRSFTLFGSFHTTKDTPNDVDAIIRVTTGSLNPETPLGKGLGGVVDAGAWNLTHKMNVLFVDSEEAEAKLIEKYAKTPRYKTKISKYSGREIESEEVLSHPSGHRSVVVNATDDSPRPWVRAKRAGWDERLTPEQEFDLDPVAAEDRLSPDLEGELVRVQSPVVKSLVITLVGGKEADPATVVTAPRPSLVPSRSTP